MPYINKEAKDRLEKTKAAQSAGELNYLINMLLLDWLEWRGQSYATYNEIIGAMECAKLEFYRRMAVPFEEVKKSVNGDVYPNFRKKAFEDIKQ